MRLSLVSTAWSVAFNTFIGTSMAAASVRTPEDIRFQWVIPTSSAGYNKGNIYFQLDAPSKYQWIAIGTGHRMKGSDMFIVYHDGGGNVTVTEKRSSGHNDPFSIRENDIEVISGSQGSGNRLVGNIRCSNYTTPRGKSKWIAAWREGAPLNSVDPDEHLLIHDGETIFEVDFSQAVIDSNGQNPFDVTNGGNETIDRGVRTVADKALMIHAVLMSLTFLVAYPIGAALMPLFGNWRLHAIWQTVAFLVMWSGFGLGYVGARENDEYFAEAHTGMGTMIVILLSFQPILGYLHHLYYRKHQNRGTISHGHIWFGRVMMLLGIIDGGLGLQLVGEAGTGGFFIGYIALACVAGLVYAVGLTYPVFRKSRVIKKSGGAVELQSK